MRTSSITTMREALDVLQLPLLTTWPAFTEAIYLIGHAGGWTGQKALWQLVLREDSGPWTRVRRHKAPQHIEPLR